MKNRINNLIWLTFLIIWRVVAECIRSFLFLIFIIPMIISNNAYEVFKEFFYESFDKQIENDRNFKTNRGEDKGI